ncbi:hypothetical protein BAOM_3778 [Peribacillus asahii]|uniref:5-formyltetrahydrofolate cyclo-ligase n=2 Tax=Peribacillus asahii TaxID=228899 RepID=A0A3Q9RQ88_9BACI|nr:hypothetical protein BAOM_3778 [Peribacillus asahii]
MKEMKRKIRNDMKATLERLSEEQRIKYTNQITEQLFHLEEWKKAKVIGITIAVPPEVPTASIIEQAWSEGKKVAVPKCYPQTKVMEFKEITSFQQLESVYSNLLEPIAETVCVDSEEIDVLIVPGLAFTKEGYRLGFGGGYYDRFLVSFKGTTLALAYECQLVESLPIEAHDLPVHQVVTTNTVFRTSTP